MTAVGTDHKMATFAGTPLAATFETQEIGNEDGTLFVTSARPVIQGSAVTMTIATGYRNKQNANHTYDTGTSEESNGVYPLRRKARYIRIKIVTSGAFTDATAVNIGFGQAGKRG